MGTDTLAWHRPLGNPTALPHSQPKSAELDGWVGCKKQTGKHNVRAFRPHLINISVIASFGMCLRGKVGIGSSG